MKWQLIVDFDGTISLDDTTDLLLQRFAKPEWQDIEDEWLAGRIGSRECMSRQIDLVRATPDDLDAFIAGIEIDWHFKSFVRQCQRRDVPLTIVSDGLDYVINAVLRRAGFDGLRVAANHLTHVGEDRWALTSPHGNAACHALSGTCKCAVAAQRAGSMTLLIGDGRSDRCLAGEADFVFAKAGLIRFCEEKQLPFRRFRDFAQASQMLMEILETTTATAELVPAATDIKETIDG